MSGAGSSKHNCRCIGRNDLAPALARPCAIQGFDRVLVNVSKKNIPGYVARGGI